MWWCNFISICHPFGVPFSSTLKRPRITLKTGAFDNVSFLLRACDRVQLEIWSWAVPFCFSFHKVERFVARGIVYTKMTARTVVNAPYFWRVYLSFKRKSIVTPWSILPYHSAPSQGAVDNTTFVQVKDKFFSSYTSLCSFKAVSPQLTLLWFFSS